MALYKVTAKRTGTWGKTRFEKGMSVEVVIQGAISSTQSKETIKNAWMKNYGIDLAQFTNDTYLDYEKLN